MPGQRCPDDFSLLRKSQAPRFTGPGAEAKTGSGSAETENGRGGMPLPPTRVQCRFAFGEIRCGIYPRKKKLFFRRPGAEAKTGSGSAETRTAEGGRFRRPVCNAGLPSGRSDAEYILGRRSCFSPGRVQRRRPVRVLPRRRTAEGACRYRRPVCSAGLPSGRSDAEYILERRSCFSPGRAQSRGLSDRIEEREATARTSRFFVSVPAADAACGARPGRAASAAGGCGSRPRRAALRESADA